ncbi:hypothetical protein BC936DRAFT_147764 [Jimgerdemannia flammicorona]|uniref:Uncharacterized protein n=1 Tax=Jimgerdemannia flammicorona TaxID=994334 RepID=A0A433D4L0_9FUNG|nr:hypothetical protein BC936DRAFT_147764 [Jimgerdemannia flammicorona]
MQMDEDVGKVAQATPVLISSWLPPFSLYPSETHVPSYTPQYPLPPPTLSITTSKKTILTTDQFDFLKDVVENVADPSEPSAAPGGPLEDGGPVAMRGSTSSNSSGSNGAAIATQPRRRATTGGNSGRGRGAEEGEGAAPAMRGRGRGPPKNRPPSRPNRNLSRGSGLL